MPYELFVAIRYLKAKRKQTFISIITVISTGGVALGVMALIIVLAVMTGFESDLRDKILGTNSHIVVLRHGSGGIKEYSRLSEKIGKVDSGIVAVTPFIYTQVMLSTKSGSSGVVLRGIDPSDIGAIDLRANMVEGKVAGLNSPDGPGGIILGKELSRNLGAVAGDEVTVISPQEVMTPMGMQPRLLKLKVAGVFSAGMHEYDSGLAYISLKDAQNFLKMKGAVTGIEVKVSDIFRAKELARAIQEKLKFPFWTRDWMAMNRNLFSALELEKLAMWIILGLVVLVAAFNIVSTLVMMTMEKNRDIAILKSMGATRKSIMAVFMAEGLIIGLMGTVIGFALGVNISLIFDHYHLIKLSGDVYYISYLPFKMRGLDLFLVGTVSVLISFLATIYPSWQASRLDPAEALRYE